MLAGYVSDEYYAALPDALLEFRTQGGGRTVARSAPSGAVVVDLPPGPCEVCLAKPGFGSKRVPVTLDPARPVHFRLLSDRLLGYAWPKWCRGGDRVQLRVP